MDKYTQLTANFIWGEFWSNNFGKPRVEPPKEYYPNILHVAQQLQLVRNRLNMDRKAGTPEITISINSAYRTAAWNASKSVEGAAGSLHLTGKAADTHANGVTLKIYFFYILRYTILNELGLYLVDDFVHAGTMDKLKIFKY